MRVPQKGTPFDISNTELTRLDKYEWDTTNRHINLTTKRINKQKSP